MSKKAVFKSLIVSAFILMLSIDKVFGGDFKPLTTWPYVYEEFQTGWITTTQGNKIKYDKINVSVSTCRAHYLQGDKIMEADARTIALLVIGEDSYVLASGKLVKILRNSVKGAVVQSIGIDAEEMSKADIGYGKSAIASTQSVSLNAITQDMDFSVNKSMSNITTDKYTGSPVSIDDKIGIYYKGSFIPATKYDINNIPGIDKQALKAFFKENKIKFSDVEDLARLVDFLYSL